MHLETRSSTMRQLKSLSWIKYLKDNKLSYLKLDLKLLESKILEGWQPSDLAGRINVNYTKNSALLRACINAWSTKLVSYIAKVLVNSRGRSSQKREIKGYKYTVLIMSQIIHIFEVFFFDNTFSRCFYNDM